MRAIGRAAFRAARRLELETREIREVQQQQFTIELTGQSQQKLERQQRLKSPQGSGYRAQHPRFGAVADHAVGDGVRPKTAQARVALVRLVDLQLAFVLI